MEVSELALRLMNFFLEIDETRHRFHRSMTRPFFTRERISHFEIFETYADEAVALISERSDEGVAVDVQDVFARFTLDAATESLFGSCVHSLRDALPYPSSMSPRTTNAPCSQAVRFARAFAEAQLAVLRRVHMGSLWPLFEMFEDKTTAPMAVIDAHLEPFVAEALSKKKGSAPTTLESKTGEVNDSDTFLDHLVRLTDGNASVLLE